MNFNYISKLSDAIDNKNVVIEIFRLGKWKHPIFGLVEGSIEKFKTFISNFKSNVLGRELSIDFKHQPDWGAAGWVKDVFIDNDKLKARIELTPKGFEKIKNKEFRYFSPEYIDNVVDKETGKKFGATLLGGALTNRPFLTNLAPVVIMSEDVLNEINTFNICVEQINTPNKTNFKPNIFSKDEVTDEMSDALNATLNSLYRRLTCDSTDARKLEELDSEITECERYLSDKDKDSLLLTQLQRDYLKKKLEEQQRGNQKYMSFEEVQSFAKEKGLSIEESLEILVPQRLVEGF